MFSLFTEIYFYCYVAFIVLHTIAIYTKKYNYTAVNSGFKFFSILVVAISLLVFIKLAAKMTTLNIVCYFVISGLILVDGIIRKRKGEWSYA